MNKKLAIMCIVIWNIMLTNLAFANSAPVYLHEYPSFEVVPMEDFPVEVQSESLNIRVDEYSSHKAFVSTEYKIKNTSDEDISASMLFPYISEGYFALGAFITIDGKAVPYETYFAGRIDPVDYFEDPERFEEQVNMDSIINSLNSPAYSPVNFNDMSAASLYSIEFESSGEEQLEVSFDIDPEKTRVLAVNFSGVSVDESGKCSLFEHIGESDVGKTGYMLVIGEDSLRGIKSSTGWEIDRQTVAARDFIMEKIINSTDAWHYIPNRNDENFYGRFIEGLDSFFEKEYIAFNDGMVMEEILANNISALIYDINLKAGAESVMSVKYPIRATIDRRKTDKYVNTFAYILSPAEGFRDFKDLDITVKLNEKDPYIIKSSLALNDAGNGLYGAHFDELPRKDFVFSTYAKKSIEKKTGRIKMFWKTLFEGGNFGLIFVFLGFLGIALSVVYRDRISVYNRRMEILSGMESEFFRMQLKFSLASCISLVLGGVVIYINNPPGPLTMIVPIVFQFIHHQFRLASENRGYAKKAY